MRSTAERSIRSERMPAQDLLTMLNHYLGEMTEVIQGRGGTIIEFIGDGIMAIFGAPAPSAIHAEQAVVAAVENGLCDPDTLVTVKLAGGDLSVRYSQGRVSLTGSAVLVFEGEFEY